MIITIDGPEASGKGLLSSYLARELDILLLDSGAIFRCVALACIESNALLFSEESLNGVLENLRVDQRPVYQPNGEVSVQVLMNGVDVTRKIRTSIISNHVAEVATYSAVREFMKETIRGIAQDQSLVADGRDMGSVVFPNADLKIYLVADIQTRANRRHKDYVQNGEKITLNEVIKEIQDRDAIDTANLAYGGLRPGDGAIAIDTSNKTIEEEVRIVRKIIKDKNLLNLSEKFAEICR